MWILENIQFPYTYLKHINKTIKFSISKIQISFI